MRCIDRFSSAEISIVFSSSLSASLRRKALPFLVGAAVVIIQNIFPASSPCFGENEWTDVTQKKSSAHNADRTF